MNHTALLVSLLAILSAASPASALTNHPLEPSAKPESSASAKAAASPSQAWLTTSAKAAPSQPFEREILDISDARWSITLDKAASWEDDELYLPPVDISKLPVRIPSGGWALLSKPDISGVALPATVEEHLWGWNGQSFGVTGNYVGVSWFEAPVDIPASWIGRRVVLDFEAVRFRAEVFVNHRLAGYDLVNSTPFQVDISEFLKPGSNTISIRITDPNGNFNWKDSQVYSWGEYLTNPTHGFGGITGKLALIATSHDYIEDIFVRNRPEMSKIDVDLSIRAASTCADAYTSVNQSADANTSADASSSVTTGANANTSPSHLIDLSVIDPDGREVYKRSYQASLKPGLNSLSYTISLPKARLWSVEEPNLYTLKVKLSPKPGTNANTNTNANTKPNASTSPSPSPSPETAKPETAIAQSDSDSRRFGFRWFEVRDISGDKQFYLNGKRIVLRSSISWSFWPSNGIMPSDELARRQVESAKALGLNMLNFHRTIGQRNVLDYADQLGLLYWEEPGGNQYPAQKFNDDNLQSRFYFAWRNEKLRRMIIRDRSHPSLIIYNMHNERGAYPQKQDYEQMAMGHQLDPSRILVYNSCNGANPEDEPNAKFKTNLMPYDHTFRDYGWWDNHHAGGPGVYHDALYVSKDEYLRGSTHKSEIVFWGEEGAIGTPPRLEKIRAELLESGKLNSWEASDYLGWYDAYDRFLKSRGFSKAFPSVDALTSSMGNVSYYYQGRIIENIRINNTVDGYAINGWESMKLENHSGVVDNYRNLKGDPTLISRYNAPLLLSVKLPTKVLPLGRKCKADVFIVNEVNLRGSYTLQLELHSPDCSIQPLHESKVRLSGGAVYGENLASEIYFTPSQSGHSRVVAKLLKGGEIVCEGSDEVYAVRFDASGISLQGSVADASGKLRTFLSKAGVQSAEYKSGKPEGDWLLVGDFEPQQWGSGMSDIMEWVYKGHTLIVVDRPERWAEFFADKEVLDYRGSKAIGTSWYGGNYFNRSHPVWEGLPSDCVFNWEYQCFATYNRRRIGLRCESGDILAAAVADHKKEVYSVLSHIRCGRGQVFLCSLDIPACIADIADDTSAESSTQAASTTAASSKPSETAAAAGSKRSEDEIDGMYEAAGTYDLSGSNPANVVGQQLLLNLIKQSSGLE